MEKTKSKRHAGIQTKFLLGLATIFIFFSGLASITVYLYQKEALENEAYRQAAFIMTSMDASRGYVREVLRPKMYDLLGRDDFILEAMSSSYVSRAISERIDTVAEDFTYRRVSINARNPDYEAIGLEREMIKYFSDNPLVDEWKKIITDENGNRFFMRFQPVLFKESCLHCHGNPGDAPAKIVEDYGDKRGFYRRAGEVAGVISVSIPVSLSLRKIKEIAIIVFSGVIPSIIFLYAIISVFFNRLIAQNLRLLLNVFRTSLKDEQGLALLEKSQSLDEIEELTGAAETIADHLQKSKHTLEQYAAEILHSKELLQSVFDGITDPVVLLDKEQKSIKIVNKAFLHRYGISMDQVLDRDIRSLGLGSPCPLVDCVDLIDNLAEQPVSQEMTLDGEIYLIYFYPVCDEGRVVKSIVCYVKDITEQKRLEMQIQHTEKLVSMGQLAAGVAHEINNPLGVILCHIDLISDDENLSAESRADLRIVEKHVDNCRNIVSDLLRFAHHTKPSLDRASINGVIREVMSITANQMAMHSITVETHFDDEIPCVQIDIDRIKQVILNVLLNSVQAIEGGGIIRITSNHKKRYGKVEIIIEDNGCGIPVELHDKIFDPFFTTKEPGKGTGLGLSVSYGILREHHGTIKVENGVDGFTRFVITLPVEDDGG